MHHAQLAESINNGSNTAVQTLNQLAASGYSNEQALASVNRLIDQQAFTLAVNDMFWMSSMLFFVLIALVWMTRPQRGGAAGGGGAH